MKTVKINMTFSNVRECRAWEDENLDRIARENGGVILMVNHEEKAGEVRLTSIVLV